MMDATKLKDYLIRHTKFILVALIILFIIIQIWRDCFSAFITVVNDIGIFIAFGTFAFSLLSWKSNQAQNANIQIVLKLEIEESNESISVPFNIMRRHLTRAEVQGLLGVLYGGNYDAQKLSISKPNFYEHLKEVQDGKLSILTIKVCDKDTFETFKKNIPSV